LLDSTIQDLTRTMAACEGDLVNSAAGRVGGPRRGGPRWPRWCGGSGWPAKRCTAGCAP